MRKVLSNSKNKESFQYFLLLFPALALFAVFVVYPVFGGIYFSFTDWNGVNMEYKFIGIENYITFFNDFYVLKPLLNTFVFAFLLTIMQNVVSLLMALALNKKFATANLLKVLWFVPVVLSPLIVGYIWGYMFTEPFAQLGKLLHIKTLANNILGNMKFSLYAAVSVNIWRMAGWTMAIYIAALKTIPQELYEVSDIEGASGWQRFKNIIFPMIAPSFTINMILTLERGFKEFDLIFALTGGGPGNSSEVISLTIYRESFEYFRAAYGSTMGVVLFVIIAVLTLIQLKFLRKREQNVI